MEAKPKKVVFVCVHNSGRSQMAEAFAKRLGAGKIEALSAGTQPAGALNPVVVEAMKEIGYDMSDHHPKLLTLDMVESADRIVTMGCGVDASTCPAAFLPTEDWGLEDPKGQPIEKVRQIRDEIKAKVEELIQDMVAEDN
ncbi:MAG: arsenate reductase ArsC [Armatimonadota bacterium]|nr:arsenate reductase ArsC [Armatimonadota bacterium]